MLFLRNSMLLAENIFTLQYLLPSTLIILISKLVDLQTLIGLRQQFSLLMQVAIRVAMISSVLPIFRLELLSRLILLKNNVYWVRNSTQYPIQNIDVNY